jgi:hypothetical protein
VTDQEVAQAMADTIRDIATAIGPYPELIDLFARHGETLQALKSDETWQIGLFLECVSGK